MFLSKQILWGWVKKLPTLIEKFYLYLFILIVPLVYNSTALIIGDRICTIDLRKMREIAFYSFAIIVCSFLQKSKWLRYFVIWCVVNWWLNHFFPRDIYIGLTNILCALILYIGLKYLFKNGFLKIDIILRLICLTVLFQFVWMLIFQKFCLFRDPVFTTNENYIPLGGWSGNPAVLGVFFACTSFLLLHYFKIKKVPVLFFVILSSVFFLKSATTILCFGVAGLFYVIAKYHIRIKTLCLAAIPIISVALGFIFIQRPNFDRLEIWQKLLRDGIKLSPFVGKGLNFFAHLYVIDKTNTPWREAHNDYLQLILELGIIGFILFSGFTISRFVVFFKEKRSDKQICIASCLVAFLTAGISLFPFHISQLCFYAVLLWSILEYSYADSKCISTLNIKRV